MTNDLVKEKYKICYLCGRKLFNKKSYTKDHIPPKSLYNKNPNGNLITVPCCNNCNNAFSKDDEAFVSALVVSSEGFSVEATKRWKEKGLRTIEKNNRLRKFHQDHLSVVNLYTEGGLYLGKHPAYQPNFELYNKSITKIVRGLFYYHTNGKRLINDPEIRYPQNDFDGDWFKEFVNTLHKITIVDGIFRYGFLQNSDNDIIQGLLLLVFFDRFFCFASFEQDVSVQ